MGLVQFLLVVNRHVERKERLDKQWAWKLSCWRSNWEKCWVMIFGRWGRCILYSVRFEWKSRARGRRELLFIFFHQQSIDRKFLLNYFWCQHLLVLEAISSFAFFSFPSQVRTLARPLTSSFGNDLEVGTRFKPIAIEQIENLPVWPKSGAINGASNMTTQKSYLIFFRGSEGRRGEYRHYIVMCSDWSTPTKS